MRAFLVACLTCALVFLAPFGPAIGDDEGSPLVPPQELYPLPGYENALSGVQQVGDPASRPILKIIDEEVRPLGIDERYWRDVTWFESSPSDLTPPDAGPV